MDTVKDKSIDDTGERMVPAYHKGHIVYAEHIVRYQAATELVKGKVVLDVASGSGYGTSLLAESAKKVYGVDLDSDAIAYARKNYGAANAEFIQGDGIKIPLETGSVDIVVSFETIEHIDDYQTFMREVKRVLKADGLFILSTPNDVEFPETNHFHIHEFKKRELENLVAKYFKFSSAYYQGTWLYNGLFPESSFSKEWRDSISTLQTAPLKPEQCIYFYLLCSNRNITESIDAFAAIGEHYSERKHQEYEASVREHMDAQAVIIKHLENAVNDKTAELNEVYNSSTWKMAKKLDKVRSTIHKK